MSALRLDDLSVDELEFSFDPYRVDPFAYSQNSKRLHIDLSVEFQIGSFACYVVSHENGWQPNVSMFKAPILSGGIAIAFKFLAVV